MKKVVTIDFYRLTDTIDINQKVIINNYRLVFPYPFLSIALVSVSLASVAGHTTDFLPR